MAGPKLSFINFGGFTGLEGVKYWGREATRFHIWDTIKCQHWFRLGGRSPPPPRPCFYRIPYFALTVPLFRVFVNQETKKPETKLNETKWYIGM